MGRDEAMIVDHVALKSLNIQRDAKWYCDNFECKVEYVDDTWALLSTKGGCKGRADSRPHLNSKP